MSYGYDAIYQLTQVTQSPNATESYSYDSVGNRLSSLGVSRYSYSSSNQLTSTPTATYTSDNNGNTLTKTEGSNVTSYAWDYENRLTQVTLPGGAVVTFKYDPFGRRVQKSSGAGTTNYLYDGADIAEEVDSAGSALARYAMGSDIDEPLAMLRGGVTSYFGADGLGSVTSLTDATGAVAASYIYDSFGKATGSTGTVLNPFRYTGREWDSETGLYFYRTRYEDPVVGRFLNEDPIGLAAGPNLYAYVANNPVNYTDPEGLKARFSQSGNTITVSASITIYGPRANAALAARWQRMINNAWNDNGSYFSFGRCRVVFDITVVADPAHNRAAQATSADNKIFVRPNGFRSWVASTPAASYGEWAADATWAAGHEAGHIFRYLNPATNKKDDYTDQTITVGNQRITHSVPDAGHFGHMMGDYGGTVVQHEIDDIFRNNSCSCTNPSSPR